MTEYLPDLPYIALSFDPEPMQEITPLRSGRRIAVDTGPTLWKGKWSTSTLEDDETSEIKSWYASVLSYTEFYAYDLTREYPRAYQNGWGSLVVDSLAFDGTCLLVDVATDGLSCELQELPNAFQFSKGDYIAFDYGTDSRALHMVTAAAIANSSGVVSSLSVTPEIRTGWGSGSPASATVILHKPAAKMVIVPGTWSSQLDPPRFGRFSFEAIQVL